MINFYHFDSDPRFPPFLLYVRWKSGVTFVEDVSVMMIAWFKQQTGITEQGHHDIPEWNQAGGTNICLFFCFLFS